MAGDISTLRKYIEMIRSLGEVSNSTDPKVRELADALEKLMASSSVGITFPSKETLSNIDRLLQGLKTVDSLTYDLAQHAIAAAKEFGAIAYQAERLGHLKVPGARTLLQPGREQLLLQPGREQLLLAERAGTAEEHATSRYKERLKEATQLLERVHELRERLAQQKSPLVGEAEILSTTTDAYERLSDAAREYEQTQIFPQVDIAAVDPFTERFGTGQIQVQVDSLRTISKEQLSQEQYTKNLVTAFEQLEARYEGLGNISSKLVGNLKRTGDVLSGQAQIIREVGDAIQEIEKVPFRADVSTGALLPEASRLETLKKTMGDPRFAQFEQYMGKLGFGMESLTQYSIEAGSGITRLAFQTGGMGDAVKTANVHLDKWMRVLPEMGTRFKSFDQMLANNITKVLRWGIAVGLVYGGWRKMQEMFQQMTESQEAMTRLAIVTGRSTAEMGAYFEAIADVAEATSTDISQAMEASVIAMRAAEGATEAERAASAFEFLSEAATLAKLSGMDMAKAADILVSTMRQVEGATDASGNAIENGSQLMEKWIVTAREGNVSMEDLAQAYATTAAAAFSAGLNVDELNAYIATMADVTNKSAQQSANALRAMFSAYETPKAIAALEQLGIGVKDYNDELKALPDILREVNALYEAGIISERQLGQVAYALGGQGARRKADILSWLKEYDRTLERVQASEAAEGQLATALGETQKTLASAIERLNTAFTELANALGVEGGLISLTTEIVEIFTSAVKIIKDVTEVLGPATAAILAFGAAWAVSTKLAIPQRLGAMVGGVGGMHPALQVMAGGGRVPPRMGMGAMYGGMAGLAAAGAGGGGAASIGTAIATAFGYTVAGPIGGMAGAAIGYAFGDMVDEMIPLWKVGLGLEEAVPVTGMTPEAIAEELRTRLYGPGIVGDIAEAGAGIGNLIAEALGQEVPKAGAEQFQAAYENLRWQAEQETGILRTDERTEELIQALQELEQAVKDATEAEGKGISRYTQYQPLVPGLGREFETRRMQMPFEFAEGDIASAREYTEIIERMEMLTGTGGLKILDAMVLSLKAQGEEVGSLSSLYEELGTDMVDWSNESLQFILDQAIAIGDLQTQVEMTGEGVEELNRRILEFSTLQRSLSTAELVKRTDIPGFTKLDETTQEEFEALKERALALQEIFAETLGIPDEVFDSIDEWVIYLEGSFQEVEGVMKQFFDLAKQEADELASAQEEAFNVRRLQDVDPSKMGEIQAANRYWIEYLSRLKGMSAQQYMEMEGQQFNLILGPGNVLQQIFSTNEAMLFALQDIRELEEKQLEGMWNIPTGATFWVPITSLFYQQQEGAGGWPELPELIDPTKKTAKNTGDIAVVSGESKITLEGILSTLQDMGVSTRPIEEWTQAQADLFLEQAAFWEGQFQTAETPWGEMVLAGAPEMTTAVRDLTTKLGEIEPSFLGEKPTETPMTNRFMEIIGIKLGERLAVKEVAPPLIDVLVTIPEIVGNFVIQNTVLLDGRVIANYINRFLSKALTDVIRAKSGRSGGTIR